LQRKDIEKNKINLAIIAYLSFCFISIFLSSNLQISATNLFGKVIQWAFFFFAVAETLNNEKRIRIFLHIFFFSATLLCVDGIYQYFTHKDFLRHRIYQDIPRIHATFYTGNDFACYLYMVMPFVLVSLFIKSRFRIFRWLFAALFILLCTCLVLTVSRGGWFSFIGIMLFMGLWIRPLGILFLTIVTLIFIAIKYYSPFLKIPTIKWVSFFNASSMDRKILWQIAWRMFQSSPLIGLGLGTFMFNFKRFMPESYIHGIQYAHNCYLQLLAELGVIGLVLFLSILVFYFYQAVKLLNSHGKIFFWYILLASTASVLGFCLHMFVETNFYSLDLGMLFWLVLGLGAASMEKVKLEAIKR
jgi:O-antigen ligase